MQNNLAQKDRQFIWHPFTPQKNRIDSIPIVRGDGALIFDDSGKSYIDAISSWWVNIHGHANPYIAEKIYRQALELEHIIFAGFTHAPAVELAEKLIPILPGKFSKIFYSDNGSTSTEVAIKMSIQYWWNQGIRNRNKIIAIKNSYHGDTFGAMSASDRSVFTLAFHDLLFEVIFINADEKLPAFNAEEIACFIYEPLVQGAGGMNMYQAVWLNETLQKFKGKGIICIADEIMTGFGRTGKLFASEFLSEEADIVCLSKALTGGTMALGVTACNEKIYQAYVDDDSRKTFFHGHSFTANPLACTAAIASLELLLKESCKVNIERIVQQQEQFKMTLQKEVHGIENIRQLGTIIAFEIAQGNKNYLNNAGLEIAKFAMEKGVYIRPLGNTVYLMPPYCITEEQLNYVQEILIEGLTLN